MNKENKQILAWMFIGIVVMVSALIIASIGIRNNLNFEEYKELLEENQVLKDAIEIHKNNYKIVIDDYLELTSDLCSMGVSDMFCNQFTMVTAYYCDEDGELNEYDWKGVVISKNHTCNVDRMTTLTAQNAVVYVSD